MRVRGSKTLFQRKLIDLHMPVAKRIVCNPIPPVLAGQPENGGRQEVLIGQDLRDISLGAPGLAEGPAYAPLGGSVGFTRFPNRFSALFRA